MRLNENIAIVGEKVILVPYRKEHVQTYHEWMKSPELLEATASEPLTFEEEMEMQQKWQMDDDKLTFIILARPQSSPSDSALTPAAAALPSAEETKSYKMIGDVNLFLPQGVKEDVECEIMIAEKDYRGRGIAGEALSLMLNYVTNPTSLPLPHSPNTSTPTSTSTTQSTQLIPPHTYPFLVRIGTSNHASINLFQRLGFAKVKTVQAFEEVEMRFGWVPRGGDVGIDAQGEGEFMACQRMKELARDKWTKRGEVVWYD